MIRALLSALLAVSLAACATTQANSAYKTGKKRDPAERAAFMRQNPCPSTGKTRGACPGYVVDHIQPLKRGGCDCPSNMQWQTIEQGKAKDRWE